MTADSSPPTPPYVRLMFLAMTWLFGISLVVCILTNHADGLPVLAFFLGLGVAGSFR